MKEITKIQHTEEELENCVDSLIEKYQEAIKGHYAQGVNIDWWLNLETLQIKEFCYFGSQYIQWQDESWKDYGICILSLTDSEAEGYWDSIRDNMTHEQEKYCEKMGWVTIWESDSEKKEDWEEWSIEDDPMWWEWKDMILDYIQKMIIFLEKFAEEPEYPELWG